MVLYLAGKQKEQPNLALVAVSSGSGNKQPVKKITWQTQAHSLEEVLHFLRHLPGRIAVAPLPQQRAANTTQAEWGARKCTQLQMQFRPASRAAGTAAGQWRPAHATSQIRQAAMLHATITLACTPAHRNMLSGPQRLILRSLP